MTDPLSPAPLPPPVYLVDSLLNLIRVTTALQFVHFLFQLTIVYCMSQFKLALVSPRNGFGR